MSHYTNQQREHARLLYEQRGSRYAAEQTGINQRTIQQWASSEHWQSRLSSVSASGPALSERQQIGWAIRKQGLADKAGAAAAETLTFLLERLHARKVYGCQDLARTFSLLTERAQELSGTGQGLGGDTLPAEQALSRLNSMLDVLEHREASGDG